MRLRIGRTQDLSQRQERLLAQVREIPVPEPPLLGKGSLIQPPWIYRLIPWVGKGVGLFLLAGILIIPFLNVPEDWGISLSLKSGQTVALPAEQSQAVDLPQIKGRMILQGPMRVEVKGIHRRLLSGRREGEFVLREGQLYFDAQAGTPKQVLIHTPLLTVRVTGTRFLLGHEAAQGSRLVVVRGVVEVMPRSLSGEWELVPAGMILTVTPEGLMEWEVLKKEFPLENFQLPAVSRRFDSLSGPEEEPSMNLRSLLWHEE